MRMAHPSIAGLGAQSRCAVDAGGISQFVSGIPCRLNVADGQHDLDMSGEKLRPPEPVYRLRDDSADRPRSRFGVALIEA
jgi:hypothetical protein